MKVANGWVAIHKKVVFSEWYKDANTIRLFFHLLFKANYEESDEEWQGTKVKRGDCIASRENLAYELGLTVAQIRRSENKLKKSNQIAVNGANKFTVYSIIKYEQYQELPEKRASKSSEFVTGTITKRATLEQEKQINKRNNPLPPEGEAGKLFSESEIPKKLIFPEWLPEKNWNQFKQHRAGMKPKLTPLAEEMALGVLVKLKEQGYDPVDLITSAIANGWKSFYPPRANAKQSQDNQKSIYSRPNTTKKGAIEL